jgi:DNA-binding SARP family transcriptional activator
VAPLTAEAVWESRTSARTLFKLLLCAPGRQAPKSLLAGILWPEVDEERARESLRSACKVLRKVLRAASGEELLEQRTTGEILRLAEQSRLWVDADAFEELVSQASQTRLPDAALALWEEANSLLRGEFFADDQSAEWARHRLVKKRQQELWLARCRMIRHLADLYVQRGQTSLAEETLEAHLLHFPTDQDALYRLLLLLEKQGCFEQASILYERNRRTLEAHGKQPAPHVRAYYEHLRKAARVQGQPPTPPQTREMISLLHQDFFSVSRADPILDTHHLSATTVQGGTMAEPLVPDSAGPALAPGMAKGVQSALDLHRELALSTHPALDRGIPLELPGASRASLVTPSVLWTDVDVLSRLSAVLDHAIGVGEKEITYADQQTRLYWRAREESILPAHTLYAHVIRHLDDLITFLARSLLPTLRLYLCEVVCRAVLLAGILLYDMGQYEKARQHYQAAFRAAAEAHNPILQALVWDG